MLLLQVLLYLIPLFYIAGALLYFAGERIGRNGVFKTAFWLAVVGGAGNLAVLVTRTVIAGRLPLASGNEFLLSFTCLTVFMYLIYEIKSGLKKAGGLVMFIAAILAFSVTILTPGQLSEMSPLMPALKSPWLSIHVLTAAFAYASLALAAGLAVVQLLSAEGSELEEKVYRIVAGGFAMLSLSIVLGAIWAEQAWGSYWSWDPKETWALITWIIYALYLHLHNKRGWKGKNASIMVIVGFVLVLFTFFGVNFLLSGLHSYAGVSPGGGSQG